MECTSYLNTYSVYKMLNYDERKFVRCYFEFYDDDITDVLEGIEDAITLLRKVKKSKSINSLIKNQLGKFEELDSYVFHRIEELSDDEDVIEYENIRMRTLKTMMKYSTVIKEIDQNSRIKLISINEKVKGTCLINKNKGRTVLLRRWNLGNIGTSKYPEWVADYTVIVIK